MTATEPYKMKGDGERARLGTVLHVAAQCVLDCNTMLSPFLLHSSTKVWQALGGKGEFQPMPRIEYVEEPTPTSRAADLPGDHRRVPRTPRWESRPVTVGATVEKPTPIFTARPLRGRGGALRLAARGCWRSAAFGRLGLRRRRQGDCHEVVAASRSGSASSTSPTPPPSPAFYASVGQVDAVVCTAGKTPYGPLAEPVLGPVARRGADKACWGRSVSVRRACRIVADGGSFTLVSGILSVEPVLTGAVASTVDGGIDAFVRSAAIEPPAAFASTRSARRSSRRRGATTARCSPAPRRSSSPRPPRRTSRPSRATPPARCCGWGTDLRAPGLPVAYPGCSVPKLGPGGGDEGSLADAHLPTEHAVGLLVRVVAGDPAVGRTEREHLLLGAVLLHEVGDGRAPIR